MSFLINIKDKVLGRQSARDYDTEEYSQDIDNNLYVPQFRGDFSPSGGIPSNGSGYDQEIRQGDYWNADSNGTISGTAVAEGDWLVASTDGASVIADFIIKSSQPSGITSGSITVLDSSTNTLNIGSTISDRYIKVEIVIVRNSLSYGQTLEFLYDTPTNNAYLSKGTITPYIAANPTLGVVITENVGLGFALELVFEATSGLGNATVYYKITKAI